MRQKRKEMAIKKRVRKGRKYKHGLWKGMLQGVVNRSDTEGPYKDEGRENQIISVPRKRFHLFLQDVDDRLQ
jgi:hypothetical protein